MTTPTRPRRQLRRIRTFLALLAGATAVLIAAVCRLESSARAFAALAVLGCLVAWVALLEIEGRLAEHLERVPQGSRRHGAGGASAASRRRRRPARSRSVA